MDNMSNKKNEHWCDDRYKDTDTHSKICKEAQALYGMLEEWLLHDMDIALVIEGQETPVRKNYIVRRCYSMLDNAEKVELLTRDANSIFAVYGCDYENRRMKWTDAKGICFQLQAQLNHMSGIAAPKTNIQKYVDLAVAYKKLAERIKNNIASDDKKKKKYCKEYIGQSL